ncbi:hypothetical protein LINPERHAP2_LOCUS45914 [Linum perenne]
MRLFGLQEQTRS